MLYFEWNSEKNEWLKDERDICFEDIVEAVNEGNVLSIIPNPQHRFSHQRVLIVAIDNYAYTVPYVQDGDKVFFKTIVPSRKATKRYIINKKKKV